MEDAATETPAPAAPVAPMVLSPALWFAQSLPRPDELANDSLYRHNPAFVVDGVCVRDDTHGSTPASRERFLSYLRDALFMVQFHDPRRYRTIIRQFRFIANRISPGVTHYHHAAKYFSIDFAQLTFDDKNTIHPWYVAYIAVLLVRDSAY